MTYLNKLFDTKKVNVLNIYITAGFPNLNDTIGVMKVLQESGTDIIELGMPYSDPLADGETIQLSSAIALQNGMSITVLLQQLQDIRNTIKVPIVLMGYLNPLLQYGFEKFCEAINKVGVDALIIPDLPIHEFETIYQPILKKFHIDFIFLITPQTTEERIRKIDELSSGFIYAVTSSSTTGTQQDFNEVEKYLQYLKTLQLSNPVLAGFGVKDKVTFDSVCKHCNGGIIGSAFIKALSSPTQKLHQTVANFVGDILNK